jgi:hypothetical protein
VLQIYNESIHDLLAPPSQRGKPSALRLKEDKAGHIQVRSMLGCRNPTDMVAGGPDSLTSWAFRRKLPSAW